MCFDHPVHLADIAYPSLNRNRAGCMEWADGVYNRTCTIMLIIMHMEENDLRGIKGDSKSAGGVCINTGEYTG